MFHFCTIDGKLEPFRRFCTSFYCCYPWTGYKKSTFNRLRVAFKFNNAIDEFLTYHGVVVPVVCMQLIVYSVCEKFQTTRAKVAPVIFIYGSLFSATEATYKVSLKMENFVEFTRTFTRIRRKPVSV